MTKSGIGTGESMMVSRPGSNNGMLPNSNTTGNISNNIAQAEIPIWVADKKKWVTGISKKTTVNDLIQAILKQCQINTNEQQLPVTYALVEFETSNFVSDSTNDVHHQMINSQKIVDGDSKVSVRFCSI